MTEIAAKVMANAPFGHAVIIQKTSTATMVTNARPALTSAGNQSGTWSRARWRFWWRAGSATSNASPSKTSDKPVSNRAVWSVSSRSDGVPAGMAISRSTAASHMRRIPTGSATQDVAPPCGGAERSSSGTLFSTASASCRAVSSGKRASRQTTADQPARASNRPSIAVCSTCE